MIGQSIGKYRIVRQLGEGGMGMVYEGIREDIGARAAIKVLRPDFAQHEETAARFFNEARAVNIIKHPAIVRIFDYGQLESGVAYLAMELLEGETLRSRIQRTGRLSEADSIRLGRQIASGLAAAHSKQIVHRDLKPENVFVVADAEAPGGERTKILDFGIAKLTTKNHAQTHRHAQLGTPIYMAPEQYLGAGEVNDRADVYSLGVILFELLSGSPPFLSNKVSELMSLHVHAAPPPLNERVPGIDQRLHGLINGMLNKAPGARPSMMEVAQQLKLLGNMSSDVLSPEALAAMARLGSDSAPDVPSAAARAQAPTLLAPSQRIAEAPTQRLPIQAKAAVPSSGWQPLTFGADRRVAPQAPQAPASGPLPLAQRPWVIPVMCLIVAGLLCLLALLSE
ncbi:MAG: serine/threonine-protein kinase [Polyangia bacterium]